MKINYIKGDLFTTDIHLIIHGCNSKGVMGSGVAAIVIRDYPEAFAKYREKYNNIGLELGDVVYVTTKGKTIGNCITQKDFGGNKDVVYCSYDAIRQCMRNVNNFCRNNNLKKVAMPMIGAGLANGEWNIISKIIEEELIDAEPVVYQL